MFSLVPSLVILLCGAAFITAQTLPPGGCNATQPCANGWCCSTYHNCGTSSAYCGPGNCISNCSPPTTVQTTAAAPPTTPSPTTAMQAGQCSPSVPCPLNYAGQTQCCSQWGWCGTGTAYCGSSPTTQPPTTQQQTTQPPTTQPPTTQQQTTQQQTTQAQTTQGVTTPPPTTQQQTTPPPTTQQTTTQAPPPPPPSAVKALYLESNINWNDPGSTVRSAVDCGYNLIVLAFYLPDGPYYGDMAGLWNGMQPADQQSVVAYAHNAGAKVIISFGGDSYIPYDSLDAAKIGRNVSTWAVNNHLDGVDFDLEKFARGFSYGSLDSTHLIQWIADATNAARSVLGSSGIITHAPVAPYFGPSGGDSTYFTGASGGYNAVYALAPSINYFLVQYYNQDCYTDYTTVFQSSAGKCNGATNGNQYPGTSVAEIASYTVGGNQIPLSKIVVGKPVLTYDAGSDYVDATTINQWFSTAKTNIGWQTGVMGWQWHDSTTNTNWIHTIYP